MRDVHKWNDKKASKVNTLYGLRKPYTRSVKIVPRHKNYHKKRRCPMERCYFVGDDVGRHLRIAHLMKPNDENYLDALKAARPFEALTSENIQKRRQVAANEFRLERELEEYEKSVDITTNGAEVSSVIEPVLKDFKAFLISVEGNFRDFKSSSHCEQEVRTTAYHLGSILALFDRKKVREDFFQAYLDPKSKPATSIHYLNSLISFMNFVITEGSESLPETVTQDNAIAMRLRFGHWRKAYGKKKAELR